MDQKKGYAFRDRTYMTQVFEYLRTNRPKALDERHLVSLTLHRRYKSLSIMAVQTNSAGDAFEIELTDGCRTFHSTLFYSSSRYHSALSNRMDACCVPPVRAGFPHGVRVPHRRCPHLARHTCHLPPESRSWLNINVELF